jgi:hypothetical protein
MIKPTPSFRWEYAALGATLETGIRQPLMSTASVMIATQQGAIPSIRHIYQKGGLIEFYCGFQGLGIALGQRILHRITTFGANQHLREAGHSLPTIAMTTALLETSLTMLGETFLTAAQTQEGKLSPFQILVERFKSKGFKALTTGIEATVLRNISFNAFFFAIPFYNQELVKEHPLSTAACSASAAVLGSHFFEVLRVKKVKDPAESYVKIVKQLFKTLGAKSLVIGIQPRLMSVGVGSCLAMAVYHKNKV